MNYLALFLGILVVILIIFLIRMYMQKGSSYAVDLNNSPVSSISYDTLSNPTSANYNYTVWIYVNSWNNSQQKWLLSRPGSNSNNTDPTLNNFTLWLENEKPILNCCYYPSDSSTPVPLTIRITDSFPIQTWTSVCVSLDGQIVDVYMNGQLVVSQKLPYLPVISTSADIDLGSEFPSDIYLASVTFDPHAIDPQTAWNNYLKGSGVSSGASSDVHMSLLISKNNVTTGDYTLF